MTEADRKAGAAAIAWWRDLHPHEDGTGGDRAAVARLKRAAAPIDAMLLREAIDLYRRVCEGLGRESLGAAEADGVAILAAVLAGVKPGERGRPRFATILGRPDESGHAPMSASRFASLVRADNAEERLRHLRRAIHLARGKPFDVARFAADMLWWDKDRRRRWIFEYYQEGRSEPVADETNLEGETAQ